MSDPLSRKIANAEFEIEQYKALRDEIMRAMEDGNQIMGFGLAAIGLLFTPALGAKDSPLGFFMFAVTIPALSSLVLSLWFAAQERIARASYFITGIESRLTVGLAPETSPTWDCWLRLPAPGTESQHHFWNTEYSGVAIFVFLIVFPMLASFWLGGTQVHFGVKLVVVAIGLALLWPAGNWMKRRIERWRRWLSSCFGDLE